MTLNELLAKVQNESGRSDLTRDDVADYFNAGCKHLADFVFNETFEPNAYKSYTVTPDSNTVTIERCHSVVGVYYKKKPLDKISIVDLENVTDGALYGFFPKWQFNTMQLVFVNNVTVDTNVFVSYREYMEPLGNETTSTHPLLTSDPTLSKLFVFYQLELLARNMNGADAYLRSMMPMYEAYVTRIIKNSLEGVIEL